MDTLVSLRRLTPADTALLRALNAVFGEAFGDSETYGRAPPSDAYLSGLLAKEHVIALVALAAGQVVGGLVAYELDKFERARRELYIYDLAVAKDHRRRGIATALIERLREIAAAAIALYGKVGAREDVLHFDIPVFGVPHGRPAGV